MGYYICGGSLQLKYMKFLAFCAILPAAFLITACEWNNDNSNHRWFAWYLQGTWVPNEPQPIYSGTLVITFDRITITGFGPNPDLPNNPYRPFRDFPKGAAMSGFSEGARVNGYTRGHIFIEDGGLRQVPYLYRYADDGRVHLLNLYFGGTVTIFERREPVSKQAVP